MSHDTLDVLAATMTEFVEEVGEVPGLMKADVDSAFRRIPVRADHRWACGVAFVVGWQVCSLPCGVMLAQCNSRRFSSQCTRRVRLAPSALCTRGKESALRLLTLLEYT